MTHKWQEIPQTGWSFDSAISFLYPEDAVETQPESNTTPTSRQLTRITYKPTATPTLITAVDLADPIPVPERGETAGKSFLAVVAWPYSGTVTWQYKDGADNWQNMPGTRFQPDTIYKAEVILYPKPGYTYAGLEPDPFTHDYADHTINQNPSFDVGDGKVTIIFPATDPNDPITELDLTLKIPAPVRGATPVWFFSGSQYTGTVAWTYGDTPLSGLFGANTAYTATVDLGSGDIHEDGAVITGNTTKVGAHYGGGGVGVYDGSTFIKEIAMATAALFTGRTRPSTPIKTSWGQGIPLIRLPSSVPLCRVWATRPILSRYQPQEARRHGEQGR